SLCEDPSGEIWMGSGQKGLFRWRSGGVEQFGDEFLRKQNLFAVAADSKGFIWMGSADGLRCYNAEGRPEEIVPLKAVVRELLVDRHGALWIGTDGQGLIRYENGTYSTLRKIDGLGSDFVNALFEDAEGSLWVGTMDGLSQLTDVKFPIHSTSDGITNGSIRSVSASQKGGLWLATNLGATYFDGKTAKNYGSELGFSNQYIKRLFEARNGDLYLIDGDKNINVLSGDRLSQVYPSPEWPGALAEDSKSIVAAVGSELVRLQNNRFEPYGYSDGAKPVYYWINNLLVSRDDAIWVASNNGIFCLQQGVKKQWSTEQGLSGKRVQSLLEDEEGAIWAGLATGMARIKAGKLDNIGVENGLYDSRIHSIVPDAKGWFWIDSSRGIFRVQRRELNDFVEGRRPAIRCEPFTGLNAIKFTDRTDQEPSGCGTLDGRIWFPGPQGVIAVDPLQFPVNRIAPPVQISGIRANGSDLGRIDRAVVEPGEGELEFHFTALSVIAPQKLRFRYRLEGYDKDWVETDERRMAFYTNLKPGNYSFHVLAANADGVWNETGDRLGVQLLPHFYETTWFFVACGGAALGLLRGAYAWRVRLLKQKQFALQKNRDLLQSEVLHRTAELAEVNNSLQCEIEEHKYTEAELIQRTRSLENEIEERKRMQSEVERVHRELIEVSRQAGMAEVATSVLHNVGNVLNSVNVSSSVIAEKVRKLRIGSVAKTAELLQKNSADLPGFFTRDPTAGKLPTFLGSLAEKLTEEQAALLKELHLLGENIEHIKDIVAMQQGYAKVSGVTEIISVAALVEDALRMNVDSLTRHQIVVTRVFSEVPTITLEKHKVLQVLVNLIRNAIQACTDSGRPDKQLVIRVLREDQGVQIHFSDNGIGISAENLTRIFAHGFTTRKDGHGFGLHSGALAAREMGGTLSVQSEGLGHGATFIIGLPLVRPCGANANAALKQTTTPARMAGDAR
ncbi:MAG: two-component regulator propeller domain-containing protein, partial [Verrucomicrobiota bacterium]